jgi:pyridinium-3,5-biscarboxylic acid mononucleotide sulfurtransferase
VDSTVVVALAARALSGGMVTAVTAVSPSLPAGELGNAKAIASALGVRHRTVRTREVQREAYARNDVMRCFHCKTELYATLGKLVADTEAGTVVLAGANADDADDFRPGLEAARQQGVRNPLLENGIRKPEVRAIARHLGLSVADKPALACLSSRVAYGIRITPQLLDRIDRAEHAVRALGFDVVRVRHLGDTASIEVAAPDVARLTAHDRLRELLRQVQSLGWREVSIDPQGYRTGSLNLMHVDAGPRRTAEGSTSAPRG